MLRIVLVFAFVVAAVVGDEACSNTHPCPFTGGDPLLVPEQIVSENGVLDYTLVMDVTELEFEWLKLKRRTYNYKVPAPTIRVKRGDYFDLKVVNAMSGPEKSEPMNGYRLPNTSNIHLHGLHVDPNQPQDFVLLEIHPGDDYTYHYQIDKELSAGAYWYHPHVHGSVHFQVESGMAGLFIVEDDDHYFTPKHIKHVSCPHHCEHEIQLLFQPLLIFNKFFTIQHDIQDNPDFMVDQIDTTAGVSLEQYLAENVHIMTTNGQIWPVVDIPTGQTKRFRMLNAGGKQTLALRIVKENGHDAKSCHILEIADDGVYFNEARKQYYGHTIMSSGRRTEWLVTCNKPGKFELRSVAVANLMSTGAVEYYDGLLLTINVVGMETNVKEQKSLPARPWYYEDLTNVKAEDIGGRFAIELSGDHLLNREFFSGVKYRHRAEVGSIQEWTITNAGHTVSHPIHIHVNAFQVISYNKYTGPYTMAESFDRVEETVLFSQDHKQCDKQYPGFSGKKYTAPLPDELDVLQYLGHDERYLLGGDDAATYVYGNPYRDTILVPPLSNITIRFLQHRFEGPVVIHCHILYHEDVGMMMVTDSVAKGAYTDDDIFPDSDGVFPGQCGECDAVYPYDQVDLPDHCYT